MSKQGYAPVVVSHVPISELPYWLIEKLSHTEAGAGSVVHVTGTIRAERVKDEVVALWTTTGHQFRMEFIR